MQVASHWPGPHLLNIIVLMVADSLFGLCGSLEVLALTSYSFLPNPPPTPHPTSFPVPNVVISLTVSVDILHHERRRRLCQTWDPQC